MSSAETPPKDPGEISKASVSSENTAEQNDRGEDQTECGDRQEPEPAKPAVDGDTEDASQLTETMPAKDKGAEDEAKPSSDGELSDEEDLLKQSETPQEEPLVDREQSDEEDLLKQSETPQEEPLVDREHSDEEDLLQTETPKEHPIADSELMEEEDLLEQTETPQEKPSVDSEHSEQEDPPEQANSPTVEATEGVSSQKDPREADQLGKDLMKEGEETAVAEEVKESERGSPTAERTIPNKPEADSAKRHAEDSVAVVEDQGKSTAAQKGSPDRVAPPTIAELLDVDSYFSYRKKVETLSLGLERQLERTKTSIKTVHSKFFTRNFCSLLIALETQLKLLDTARLGLMGFVRELLEAGHSKDATPEMVLVGEAAMTLATALSLPPLDEWSCKFGANDQRPNAQDACMAFLALFKDVFCLRLWSVQKVRKTLQSQLKGRELATAESILREKLEDPEFLWERVKKVARAFMTNVQAGDCLCKCLGFGCLFPQPPGTAHIFEDMEALLSRPLKPRITKFLKEQFTLFHAQLKTGQDEFGCLQEKLRETEAQLEKAKEAAELLERLLTRARLSLDENAKTTAGSSTGPSQAALPEQSSVSAAKLPASDQRQPGTPWHMSVLQKAISKVIDENFIPLTHTPGDTVVEDLLASECTQSCYTLMPEHLRECIKDSTRKPIAIHPIKSNSEPTSGNASPSGSAATSPKHRPETDAVARLAEAQEKRAKLAKIAADIEFKKQQEEREKAALRRSAGLATDVASETVHAKCTAFRGLDGASCLHKDQNSDIHGMQKYVMLTCTDECKMFFHHDCWKLVEKLHRGKHSSWRLKRGVACLTEGCPGTISQCSLQHGLPKEPLEVQVLVHPEEKQAPVLEGKQRHAKPKKKQSDWGQGPKGHDAKHKSRRATETAESASISEPASIDIPKAVPPSPPKPTIDISTVDLESLKPVDREEHIVSPQKKQEKVRPQKQKRYVQPDIVIPDDQEDDDYDLPNAWGVRPRPPPPESNFFDELPQVVPSFAAQHNPGAPQAAAPVAPPRRPRGEGFFGEAGESLVSSRSQMEATDQAMQFPRLDEAAIAASDPDFFKFARSVQEVISDLKNSDASRQFVSLALEQLDIDSWVEQGVIPEVQLRDVLSTFGPLDKLQLFSFLGIATVRFHSLEDAARAKEAMDGSIIGEFEVKVSYLSLFPSDIIFKKKLGEDVWAKYNTSDIQLALRTAWRAEQREQALAEEEAARGGPDWQDDAKRQQEELDRLAREHKQAEAERKLQEEALRKDQPASRPASRLSQTSFPETPPPGSEPFTQVTGFQVPPSSEGTRSPELSSWEKVKEEGFPTTSILKSRPLSHAEPYQPPPPTEPLPKKNTRLNALATEFVPSSFGSSPGSLYSDHTHGEVTVPENLNKFQRVEVVGCDDYHLSLYMKDKKAFGVVPNQLINRGSDDLPTALIFYQMDSAQLYGLWRVLKPEINHGEKVIVVHLVEEFEPLAENDWWSLLEYDESANCYAYPQCLDRPRTLELMKLFAKQKAPTAPARKTSLPVSGTVEREQKEVLRREQEEVLRRLEQSRLDEEFARKLHEEMNAAPSPPRSPPAAELSDFELAMRLQEEEQRRTQPTSFAAAVRQPPQPILPSRGNYSSKPPSTPSSARNNFSAFFPSAGETTRSLQAEADPWGKEATTTGHEWWNVSDNVSMPDDSAWCQDPVGWGTTKNDGAQDVGNSTRRLHGAQNENNWGSKEPGLKTLDTSPSRRLGEDRNRVTETDTENKSESPPATYDDILAMLGIEPS